MSMNFTYFAFICIKHKAKLARAMTTHMVKATIPNREVESLQHKVKGSLRHSFITSHSMLCMRMLGETIYNMLNRS